MLSIVSQTLSILAGNEVIDTIYLKSVSDFLIVGLLTVNLKTSGRKPFIILI